MRTIVWSCLAALLCSGPVAAGEPVSFRRDVAPLLAKRCLACHGAKKVEGGFRLDTYEHLLMPGDSGTPGVTAGKLDDSEAFRRMASNDTSERMPKDGDPLTADQLEVIQRWITSGASFDGPDPKLPLGVIIPPPVHPQPPAAYPHVVPITALAFSPDGAQLFVGGYYELTVWNVADGHLAGRISNVGQRTYGIALSPDGKFLAVACGAPAQLGEVRIFDRESRELVQVLAPTSDVVLDVAYNPAGDRLAVAAADGTVLIFDPHQPLALRTISSHSDWVTALAWSGDGTLLATASRDRTAKVFDAATGELKTTYSGHGEPVQGVAFHPDGKDVYSAGADKKIHRWSIADGKKNAEMKLGDSVFKLVVAGSHLFAPSADKTVREFDTANNNAVRTYSGHQDWVLCSAVHSGTKRLATGAFDGEVRVWSLEDGKLLTQFVAAPGLVPPHK